MFTLDTLTAAKLVELEVLSQKNRQPDENPGAKLTIGEISLPADMLAHFDGSLLSFLFAKAAGKQGELGGMESLKLTPAAEKLGALRWKHVFAGYTLVIDRGTGGRSNITITDCELSGIRLTPKDGGSCAMKCIVESPDVSGDTFGKLAKLKSCEIKITLQPPSVEGDLVTPKPAAKAGQAPRKTATEAFVGAHAGGVQ